MLSGILDWQQWYQLGTSPIYRSVTVISNLQLSDVKEKGNSDNKVKDPDAEHNYLGSFQGYKTESSRKLSNFNSHWTKTLHQNNLKNNYILFTLS